MEMVNGHVQLPLPFKTDDPKLPNNKGVAMKRLHQLKTKFLNKPKFADQYKTFMERVIKEGQAEIVPEGTNPSSVWYIPHHGIYHPRKPEKLRVVLDCASRYEGVSLNDVLLQGPNMTNNLLGVLLRFRQEEVAVVGDIESMFYQVKVAPQHRDYLRFLWWEDGDLKNKPQDYRMTVHVFGATSSPGCANYSLKKVADLYEPEYGKDAAEFVRKGFYVDDGLLSVPTVEDAASLVTRTRNMLKRGGFVLHKFLSNSTEFLQTLPAETVAVKVNKLDLSDLPTEHTLGVLWNASEDNFTFEAKLKEKPTTRRGILSTVSSIFDPFGFVGPYVLLGKRILQQVCAEGSDWDDPVEGEILQQWNEWKKQLPHLRDIVIDRCYKPIEQQPSRIVSAELHHFSDASTLGYGQCSYLRLVNEQGHVKVSLLISKCRVCSLKVTTIPRLELVAAAVSVRIAGILREELQYENIQEHFWTDSQVVLGYINNAAKRFHTFVANRIQQIHDGSQPEQWHYISSKDNPADFASRGLNAENLKKCEMWWHGPMFLREGKYAIKEIDLPEITNDDVEVKKAKVLASHAAYT